jgi:hypothetical protein
VDALAITLFPGLPDACAGQPRRRFDMRSVSLAVALGLCCAVPYAAMASASATTTANTSTKAAPSSHRGYVSGFGQSVDTGTLEHLSGGTDISNRITLNGNVSDNNTDHSTTGLNSIASGAFSGAVGLPMVIQNSGNSVLIQNATIINVQMQP